MSEVAPLVRRPAKISYGSTYPELGIRSFGKGTFHKAPVQGSEVGTKKLFKISPGDLVFSNVFAWEGAVAMAQEADAGRYGSHRFITCAPRAALVTSRFLCFYFLTQDGLQKLLKASPGGAGRNRTLGLDRLAGIEVPVPPFGRQVWFDDLQQRVEGLTELQVQSAAEVNALLPSILDQAFKGEL